ncbi:MAG: type II secretion system GspH family protein [Acidobacteria bacterium]|nr:type II secretion system GspH family protein [Acidobacteriota bacterium]
MRSPRRAEAGYTLVTLLAAVTIMLILMAAAMPSWRYVMKNDREEELIFRGGEIADAIQRFQQRNGNALPPSLEVLVKGKFLRREYKDPMTKDGKWRFIRPGEAIGPIRPPGAGTAGSRTTTTTTTTTTRPSAFRQPSGAGGTLGGIQGVASTSEEDSLRVFNGRTKYNEWLFLAGQPRIVGRAPRSPGVQGAVPGQPAGRPGVPGAAPGVSPGTRR